SDALTGQAIAAFVILRHDHTPTAELAEDLREHVGRHIGPIAKPKTVLFTEDLPKTRSGKIMRRLLRDVSEDQALGATTTLGDPTPRADPGVVGSISARSLTLATADED